MAAAAVPLAPLIPATPVAAAAAGAPSGMNGPKRPGVIPPRLPEPRRQVPGQNAALTANR
jgi:hypothetical protein